MLKKQKKERKDPFFDIDFFRTDCRLERFLFSLSISIKIDQRIYKNEHPQVYARKLIKRGRSLAG